MMWNLADKILSSRFLIGTAQYPTLETMRLALLQSSASVVTVALKRQQYAGMQSNIFFDLIRSTQCHLLPNTAGCLSAEDAVNLAEAAREIFETNWIKLEVTGDEYNLQPDPFELVKAAQMLVKRGFEVFPYCTDDLVLCRRLVEAGCRILMPWAAPIGTGLGILDPYALTTLRARFSDITIIIDAGIGKPSQAASVMEMGFDAVLLNTAVSNSPDPVKMAGAFRDAIIAGRSAYEAGLMPARSLAVPSTSLLDTPFWHQELTK